ncbi:MAG: glycosyltransferase family 87 protein [Flavobacteriales bacterium]
MRRSLRIATGVIAAVCIAFGVLNLVNDRFELWDLRVYYDAAGKLLAGESPYHQAFGLSSGFYKYSPAAAWFFAPLHVFGWMGARMIYYLVLVVAIAYSLPRLTDRIGRLHGFSNRKQGWVIATVALVLAGHLSRELFLGNVNWFLLLLTLAAFFSLEKHPVRSGILLGVVLAFKPHFAVLLPWYVLRRRWKELGVALTTLAVLFIAPALFIGWDANWTLLAEWGETMLSHNAGLAESPNTLYGVPARMLGWTGSWPVVITLAAVALFILAFVLRNFWHEATQNASSPVNHFTEFALIMALIPNLVHTDTEHFMWTFPLLAVLFLQLFSGTLPRWKVGVAVTLIAIAVIPYTTATPDLWGAEGSRFLEQSGVLGWANAVFIVLALWLRPRVEGIFD